MVKCSHIPLTKMIFLVGLSKLGYYLIDVLHRVPPNVGQIAKDSILYLSVFPLVDGIVSYCLLFIMTMYFMNGFSFIMVASFFILKLFLYDNIQT